VIKQSQPLALEATAGALLDFDLLVALRCQPAEGGAALLAGRRGAASMPLQRGGWGAGVASGRVSALRGQARIPADVPGKAVRVARGGGIDGSGSSFARARWSRYPYLRGNQPLGQVTVTTRPYATEIPALPQSLDVPFDNGMRVLGYERA
jgi:hypothetical protein